MSDVITMPPEESESTDGSGGQSWKAVAYTVSVKMQGNGLVIAGKACGVRADGKGFFAFIDLPLIYPEEFNWTAKAKERLDIFLDCSCSALTGVCNYHQMMNEAWTKEDALRNTILEAEIPEALKGHVRPTNPEPRKKVWPA